jgi:hypothetical protein
MPGMGSSTGAANYYNSGTAAPTIQTMIDAEVRRAQNVKTLAQSKAHKKETQRAKTLAKAHKEADRTIQRVEQLKDPNTKKAANINQTTKTKQATKTNQTTKQAAKTEQAGKSAPMVSVFAILGTLFVSVLMVFVVLAQINFNETAAESVRLNVLIDELAQRQRELELSFENAVDIREVERFARDELGMSRPDTRQIMIIEAAPRDIALTLDSREDRGLQGFGLFLRSLTEYFRRDY